MLLYRLAQAQLVKLVVPFLLDGRNAGGLVGDRLRLAQIHPAVQKGPPGELAGLRRPATARKEILQDLLGDHRIAVTADFQEVVAGVGMRRLEEGEHHIIDARAGPIAIIRVPSLAGQGNRAKNLPDQPGGIRTAGAHQCERGCACRRGEGCDGVGGIRHGAHPNAAAAECKTKA